MLARRCVEAVYEDSDADAVERFIMLEKRYGRERVEAAYEVVADKDPSNPKLFHPHGGGDGGG
jgi:hypothetical protein